MTQYVWKLDGTCGLSREAIGNKAYGLNQMVRLGVPVPPAFVLIPGDWVLDEVWTEIVRAVRQLESVSGRSFGGTAGEPLLVSVRSGAAISMPGMMDTILNVGVTPDVLQKISRHNAEFASDLAHRVEQQICQDDSGSSYCAFEQLRTAIEVVRRSWDSDRAQHFRRARGIADETGTSIVVQVMVFGNFDNFSGSGVAFSRNPVTGEDCLFGEWLRTAQGEDLVSGRVTGFALGGLMRSIPSAYSQLAVIACKLERAFLRIQDIEFTIESGNLWILQCRSAVVSTQATLRFAVSMAEAGAISRRSAAEMLSRKDITDLRHPRLMTDGAAVLGTGIVASPGFASGLVQRFIEVGQATDKIHVGEAMILLRRTTDPNDVHMMSVSSAVVTETGGSTSHAAIVCRELKVPCIVGCGPEVGRTIMGRVVTVDADTGTIYDGILPISPSVGSDDDDLVKVLNWSTNLQ